MPRNLRFAVTNGPSMPARLTLTAVTVLALAACSGPATVAGPGPSRTAAAPDIATPPDTTTAVSPSASAAPSADEHAVLGQSGPTWWSGFQVTLSSATYSAAQHQLSLEADITNTGAIDTTLGSTRSLIAVDTAGQLVPLRSTTDTIPHGATTQNTLVFPDLPDDFVLAEAQLVLGDHGQHQAVFPLDGSDPTATPVAELPDVLTIADAHTATTYAVTSVRLIPASCSGTNPVDIQYTPLIEDQLVLELTGDLASTSASVGGVAVGAARATPLSGTTAVAGPELNDVLGAATSPREDLHLCFPLPADTHGPVDVQIDARLVGEDFITASGTVTLP